MINSVDQINISIASHEHLCVCVGKKLKIHLGECPSYLVIPWNTVLRLYSRFLDLFSCVNTTFFLLKDQINVFFSVYDE